MFKSANYLVFIMMVTLALAGCSSMAKKSQNFYFGNYSEAEQHFNKGEFEAAITKYTQYRTENPDGNLAIIALYYIGKSHQALGHTELAKAAFTDIVKNYPDVVWANFSEAQLKELNPA